MAQAGQAVCGVLGLMGEGFGALMSDRVQGGWVDSLTRATFPQGCNDWH